MGVACLTLYVCVPELLTISSLYEQRLCSLYYIDRRDMPLSCHSVSSILLARSWCASSSIAWFTASPRGNYHKPSVDSVQAETQLTRSLLSFRCKRSAENKIWICMQSLSTWPGQLILSSEWPWGRFFRNFAASENSWLWSICFMIAWSGTFWRRVVWATFYF